MNELWLLVDHWRRDEAAAAESWVEQRIWLDAANELAAVLTRYEGMGLMLDEAEKQALQQYVSCAIGQAESQMRHAEITGKDPKWERAQVALYRGLQEKLAIARAEAP